MLLEISVVIAALIWVFRHQITELYLRYKFNKTKHSEFVGYWTITNTNENMTTKIPCTAIREGKDILCTGYMNNCKNIDLNKCGLEISLFEENESKLAYPLIISNDLMPDYISAQLNSGTESTSLVARGWIHNLPHLQENEAEINIHWNRSRNSRYIDNFNVRLPIKKFQEWSRVKRDYHYISNSVGN